MTQNRGYAVVAALALLATLVVNALANILPINGLNTGQVSALYPSLFTPAPITFSIWSVIYLLLIGFVITLFSSRTDAIRPIALLFTLSCILNCAWIFAWHYLIVPVSVLLMLALLIVLLRLFLVSRAVDEGTKRKNFFLKVPIAIYLAWICVAIIANIAAWLVSMDWDGGTPGQIFWTVVMMSIAGALAIIFVTKYREYAFAAVVGWALAGIALKEVSIIAPVGWSLAGILSVITIASILRRPRHVS